jgi:hypothetical protein
MICDDDDDVSVLDKNICTVGIKVAFLAAKTLFSTTPLRAVAMNE